MPIDLPDDTRTQAIASIQRYAREHLDDELGSLAARGLLDYFLAELGPVVYNQAVRDVQERVHARVAELDLDVHADEFTFWQK